MADYRLHCFYDSGNAFKVAMMLDLAGFSWEAVAVKPRDDAAHSPDWWARANRFGEVPFLERNGKLPSQSA